MTVKPVKNKSEMDFIVGFNNYLAPFEKNHYVTLKETLPSVHVIGVPRSGTTLLTQLICSALDVGHINNLIARFWKAPVTGIRLSRQILGDEYESTLSSKFGKTNQIQEPNEFSYFWSDMLGYENFEQKTDEEAEQIDWNRVSIVVRNMIGAFEKPLVFKSFRLGWHIKMMHEQLNKTCFVWIKRKPIDNAISLLEMRKKNFGSIDKWGSLKPLEYEMLKNKNRYEQIAGQVYFLEKAYQEQLNRIPESNYLVLNYDEVCAKPNDSIEAVRQLINANGGEVEIVWQDVPPQEPSKKTAISSKHYLKMEETIRSFYS